LGITSTEFAVSGKLSEQIYHFFGLLHCATSVQNFWSNVCIVVTGVFKELERQCLQSSNYITDSTKNNAVLVQVGGAMLYLLC